MVAALAASSMVARSSTQQADGQAVAHLGVDVGGADDLVGQAGPGEGVLVGAARPADDGDALCAAGGLGLGDERGCGGQRGAPRCRRERVALADQRLLHPSVALHRFEVEPAAVAQPAVVHRVAVHADIAQHLVAAALHHRAAADRAGGARALLLAEIPRAGLEAVRLGGERPDRADLHGVAAEVAAERLVGEGGDVGVVAAAVEVDQRIAGHLVGEAGAAVAQDAALAVEVDDVADRDRLLVVALLLDEAALAGAVAERLVLQGALAALVAHRAVERVVGEQQFEHAFLHPLGGLALGVDLHVRGHRHHARDGDGRAAARVALDQAHAALAHRGHAVVVAEAGDVLAGVGGGLDDQLPLARHARTPLTVMLTALGSTGGVSAASVISWLRPR